MLRKLLGLRDKVEARDVLLACLFLFTEQGEEEISVPEILEGISRLQGVLPLGYDFSKGFLYSSKLFVHITQLEENGYIRRYQYTHDGFLPKSYVALTMLGRGRAEKTTEQLPQPTIDALREAVGAAVAQHREYWRLYARI
jgi:hypothetical protein